jgi:hypothetical protein
MTDQASVEGMDTALAALSVAAGDTQPPAGNDGAAPRDGADTGKSAGQSGDDDLRKKVDGLVSMMGRFGNDVGEVRKLGSELKGVLAGVNVAGGVPQRTAIQQAQESAFKALIAKVESGDAELAEKIADDPKAILKIIAQVAKASLQEVASVLQSRDEHYEHRLAEVDPEINATRDRIAKLREDPRWESFSDKQLAILIRNADEAKNRTGGATMTTTGQRTVPAYPGVPGGQRRTVASADGGGESKDASKDPLFMALFGEGMKQRYGAKFDEAVKA